MNHLKELKMDVKASSRENETPIIELEGVYKGYSQLVLGDINLQIFKGEMTALVGKSGAGKTTLLNIAGFLEKPDKGVVKYKKQMVNLKNEKLLARLRRDQIGFIVQNYALIQNRNVFYNIALPLYCRKEKKPMIEKKCTAIAKGLGIGDLLQKFPDELSGGEAQRVGIARALVKEPEIILADEPTGALDDETESGILQIFGNLKDQGISILLATHNMRIADQCDRVLKLEGSS